MKLPPVTSRTIALWLKIKSLGMLGIALALSACTSANFDQTIAEANTQATDFTNGHLVLVQTQAQRADVARRADTLLQQPLAQDQAVYLALLNSPAVQVLLAEQWSDAAQTAQTGDLLNPTLTLARLKTANTLELGRFLSVGLLEVFTLPQRRKNIAYQRHQQQLRLTLRVIDLVTQVRQAWVNAVAAQQRLVYVKQVSEAAQASSELARRLQVAGNFTSLQRAKQQLFYAEARTQWVLAQQTSLSTRETLVRLLGLTDAQAQTLTLPARLPDLPALPRQPDEVSKLASKGRLDIQLAQADLDAQAHAQGLAWLTTVTDLELGVRSDTERDRTSGISTNKQGVEVSVRLPIFDWGKNQREAMNAQTLAAANRLEATVRAAGSNLRTHYAAYRTTFEIATHYRDEVVPLSKTISEENLLRYNGMLIGVFDLLADARDQVNSVMSSITATQQFWLADAALQNTLMGAPTSEIADVIAVREADNASH